MMHDFSTVPMPERIARLPRDKRGYPIPSSAIVNLDGSVDFTTLDMKKWVRLYKLRGCGVCGTAMYSRVWFIGGHLSHHNRMFFDHPMHEECARYALQVCPFLAIPRMGYRKRDNNEMSENALGPTVLNMVSLERSSALMLGKTHSYKLVKIRDSILLFASPWESVTWWSAGKELLE
jgi:hypothetical protein